MTLKKSEEKYREAYNTANLYKELSAHDINNILQNILLSAELCILFLEENKNQDKLIENLENIIDQVKRGSNLISKLLKLSKIEELQMPIESKDVCKILKESIDSILNSFQNRDIEIQVNSCDEKIFAQVNDLLIDIFENVLINGIRHNNKSKVEISIKLSRVKKRGVKYVKIEFKDNGIGIINRRKKIIFQKNLKNYESGKGMGLGLSLVKKIIDSYNGEIWVEDKVKGDYKKGSNFVILLLEAI